MLAVGLGGEQVSRIDATGSHLREELLDQRVDATGAEDKLDRGVNPEEQEGSASG